MDSKKSEFRKGWRALVASFLGISLGTSSLYFYSLGVFIKPLAEDFYWSRGQASLGALVGTICSAIAAIHVGRMVDRFGPVKIALMSLLLLSACFTALGTFTSGLLSFLCLMGLLSFITVGSTPISYARLVVSKFESHRGLALGIALSGPGLGALLVPPLLTPYIAANGWRSGYFALAAVIALAMPLLWLLMRGLEVKPQRQGHTEHVTTPLMETLLDKAFITIAVIFFFASIGVFGTVVHFLPMLTDAGLSPERAGFLTGIIGITAIVGRIVAGALLDRFRSDLVVSGLWITAAIGFTMLSLGGVSFAIPGALIAGFAIGAENDLMAFLCGRHFKHRSYSQAYGALYAVFLIGAAIGPILSGFLFDLNGNYKIALLASVSTLLIAAIAAHNLRTLKHANN